MYVYLYAMFPQHHSNDSNKALLFFMISYEMEAMLVIEMSRRDFFLLSLWFDCKSFVLHLLIVYFECACAQLDD